MIIATAGHIDHGKTSLVKALTGVDTDRLSDEKRRGMSIDLGFAYTATRSGALVGFVDTPGHEAFVRTMIAGVSGVDLALLVVAADDGVMPQTREHLMILELLGLERVIVAITKIDRVALSRVAEVTEQIRILLPRHGLQDVPLFQVSSQSGAGIEDLREAILALASKDEAQGAGRGLKRFAVDRAFTLPGVGVVVTGYVLDGSLGIGDKFIHHPTGRQIRVRQIKIHDRHVDEVFAGQRCALSLSGLSAGVGARGDSLLDPAFYAPTRHAIVALQTLPCQDFHKWTAAHLHIGTAQTTGRIKSVGNDDAGSCSKKLAAIEFDAPQILLHGDRIVVRDASAQRTIAGGRVIHRERYEKLHKRDPSRLTAYCGQTVSECVSKAASRHIVEIESIRLLFGLDHEQIRTIEDALALRRLRPSNRHWVSESFSESLSAAVAGYFLIEGAAARRSDRMDAGAVRKVVAPALTPAEFDEMCGDLAARGLVDFEGRWLSPPGKARPEAPIEDHWPRIRRLLESSNLNPFTVADIARRLGRSPQHVMPVLERHYRRGELMRVGSTRFVPLTTFRRLWTILQNLAPVTRGQPLTVSDFRDAAGCGRDLASDMLEAFDSIGVTIRAGKFRTVRRTIGDGHVKANSGTEAADQDSREGR